MCPGAGHDLDANRFRYLGLARDSESGCLAVQGPIAGSRWHDCRAGARLYAATMAWALRALARCSNCDPHRGLYRPTTAVAISTTVASLYCFLARPHRKRDAGLVSRQPYPRCNAHHSWRVPPALAHRALYG